MSDAKELTEKELAKIKAQHDEGATFIVNGEQLYWDGDLSNVDVNAVEAATGSSVQKFLEGLEEGTMTSITAVIFMLKKRKDPRTKYSSIVFKLSEFTAVYHSKADESEEGQVPPTEAAPEAAA